MASVYCLTMYKLRSIVPTAVRICNDITVYLWGHLKYWRHLNVRYKNKQHLGGNGNGVKHISHGVNWTSGNQISYKILSTGETSKTTFESVKVANEEEVVSHALVFSWHKRFKMGERAIDRQGQWRKKKIIMMVPLIGNAITENWRFTVQKLAEKFDISVGSIHSILTKRSADEKDT